VPIPSHARAPFTGGMKSTTTNRPTITK
jgi:hypothetical protein